MNYFTIILCWLALNPSLVEVRALYVKASESSENVAKLSRKLENININANPVLVGYKAASLTLQAKHLKGAKNKKAKFKEGAGLLEEILTKFPNRIELRLIRLSIQENTPKLLKYKGNITEDKAFILNNYSGTKSKHLKNHILGYVLQSDAFTPQEKEVFSDK